MTVWSQYTLEYIENFITLVRRQHQKKESFVLQYMSPLFIIFTIPAPNQQAYN